jgi:hypothetical protein
MLEEFRENPYEYFRPQSFFGGNAFMDSFPSFNIDFPKFERDPQMDKMTQEMDKKMADAWKQEEGQQQKP